MDKKLSTLAQSVDAINHPETGQLAQFKKDVLDRLDNDVVKASIQQQVGENVEADLYNRLTNRLLRDDQFLKTLAAKVAASSSKTVQP